MATEALEVRMAKLEGGYAQINERLAGVEREVGALRSELHGEIEGVRSDSRDIRRQLSSQFYWLLTLILGSILIPILRDLALVR